VFKNVNLTHAYRSSYAITAWRSNVEYDPGDRTKTYTNTNLFITQYDVGQLVLTEQFSPLLGIDVAFHNTLTARAEYKKQRNLTMSFINNQLTETEGNEIVIGSGYRIKNLALVVSSVTGGGRISRSNNDLVLKVDLGFRKDKTTLRRVDERNSQVSAGQNRINIYVTADYTINERFNFQAFFKRDVSDPFVSSQFKNSNTFAGVTMRFNLAQ
jgi:cell surface protein SprA